MHSALVVLIVDAGNTERGSYCLPNVLEHVVLGVGIRSVSSPTWGEGEVEVEEEGEGDHKQS